MRRACVRVRVSPAAHPFAHPSGLFVRLFVRLRRLGTRRLDSKTTRLDDSELDDLPVYTFGSRRRRPKKEEGKKKRIKKSNKNHKITY